MNKLHPLQPRSWSTDTHRETQHPSMDFFPKSVLLHDTGQGHFQQLGVDVKVCQLPAAQPGRIVSFEPSTSNLFIHGTI